MKHTEFCDTFKSIRHHIVDEIKAAVKAHGGEYSWDEDGDYPIVAANPTSFYPEPLDVCIRSMEIAPNGEIFIEAIGNKYGNEIRNLSLDDIFVEHLEFILDYMGDAPDVSDVTIPFKQ